MVRRVHEEAERRFEGVADLVAVEREGETGTHQPDDRRDAEAGACQVGRQIADRRHEQAVEADLLFRLPERRVERPGVLLVDLAARKRHLPAVVAQRLRPLGQQHGGVMMGDDRHQHGRGARRSPVVKWRMVRIEGVIARFRERVLAREGQRRRKQPFPRPRQKIVHVDRSGDRLAQSHGASIAAAGAMGKNRPPDHTPNQTSPSTSFSEPRSTRS